MSYHPDLGRFAERDPNPEGEYADGMNFYVLGLGNPINHVDPTGYAANATQPTTQPVKGILVGYPINNYVIMNMVCEQNGSVTYNGQYNNYDVFVIRKSGTITWRYNNPGNIVKGDYANSHGAIGAGPKFAIFPDYATGKAAIKPLLLTDKYKGLSIDKAIATYAPPNENDTANYQNIVRTIVGVPGTTKISDLNQVQLDKVVDAICKVEGYKEGDVTEEAKFD